MYTDLISSSSIDETDAHNSINFSNPETHKLTIYSNLILIPSCGWLWTHWCSGIILSIAAQRANQENCTSTDYHKDYTKKTSKREGLLVIHLRNFFLKSWWLHNWDRKIAGNLADNKEPLVIGVILNTVLIPEGKLVIKVMSFDFIWEVWALGACKGLTDHTRSSLLNIVLINADISHCKEPPLRYKISPKYEEPKESAINELEEEDVLPIDEFIVDWMSVDKMNVVTDEVGVSIVD